jgi:hypothetical protein
MRRLPVSIIVAILVGVVILAVAPSCGTGEPLKKGPSAPHFAWVAAGAGYEVHIQGVEEGIQEVYVEFASCRRQGPYWPPAIVTTATGIVTDSIEMKDDTSGIVVLIGNGNTVYTWRFNITNGVPDLYPLMSDDPIKDLEGMCGIPPYPSIYIGIGAVLGAGVLAYVLRRRFIAVHREG